MTISLSGTNPPVASADALKTIEAARTDVNHPVWTTWTDVQREALWQAGYPPAPPETHTPPPAAAPPPATKAPTSATLTREQAQAEIDAHMAPGSVYWSPQTPTPESQKIGERLVALRRIVNSATEVPETTSETHPAEPPAGDDVSTLPQLADGEPWDPARVAEARQELVGRGFSEQFAAEGLQLYGELSGQPAPPLEETLAQIPDTVLDQADAVMQMIPQGMWNDLVDRGVAMQPRFINFLASLGKHLAPALAEHEAMAKDPKHPTWNDPARHRALSVRLAGTRVKVRI